MGKHDTDIELIEGFYRNELSPSDRTLFEDRLKTDDAFKNLNDKYNRFFELVKEDSNIELKEFLKSIESNPKSTPPAPTSSFTPSKLKWLVLLAALLIGGFFGKKILNDNDNASGLYASYYKAYPNTYVNIERSSGNEVNEIEQTFLMYKEGNFSSALNGLEKLYQKSTDKKLLVYKAICLMELNKHQESINIFESLKGSNKNITEVAQWYLALNQLKLGFRDKAKIELSNILDSDQTYQRTNATKLLNQLK